MRRAVLLLLYRHPYFVSYALYVIDTVPPLSVSEVVTPDVYCVLAVTIRAQGFEPRAHVPVCAAISSNGPPRKDFVLDRGVVGISPPLILGAAFLTSENAERLLLAQDREMRYGIERGSIMEGMIGVQPSTL